MRDFTNRPWRDDEWHHLGDRKRLYEITPGHFVLCYGNHGPMLMARSKNGACIAAGQGTYRDYLPWRK